MSFTEALGMGEFRPNTKVDFGKIVEVRSTRGVFVAFEGTDGVGKSTQVKFAADWIKNRGWEVVTTLEPGGTELGADLREMLLHSGRIFPRAEALLFAADRAQHVAELIAPALNAGKVVISDRYLASSVAYQGQGRELGAKEIRDLSLWATGGLAPNLTVLLDLDPEIAWERHRRAVGTPELPEPLADSGVTREHQQRDEIRDEPDRMEREGLDFQRKVRAEFLRMAEGNETWLVVDGNLPPAEIAAQVRLRLATILPVMKSW